MSLLDECITLYTRPFFYHPKKEKRKKEKVNSNVIKVRIKIKRFQMVIKGQ